MTIVCIKAKKIADSILENEDGIFSVYPNEYPKGIIGYWMLKRFNRWKVMNFLPIN